MKWPGWIRNLCLLGFVAASVLAIAQGTGGLFKDGLPKSKIAIKDLPDDYQAVSIRTASDASLFGEMFSSPMGLIMMYGSIGGGNGNSQQGQVMRLLDASAISFTKGETTEVQGAKFLITYKIELNVAETQSMMENHSEPLMELVLVRFDTIKALAPKPDFTKATLSGLFGPTPVEVRSMAANRASTLSNFKQSATAMIIYSTDYDDEIPYVQDTKSALAVLAPYAKNKETFKTYNPLGSEIRLNMAVSGVNNAAIPAPAETPLFYESTAWPDGTRCVSFCDSHARFVDSEEWSRLQPALHVRLPRKGKPLPPLYWKQLHYDDTPNPGSAPIPPRVAPPAQAVPPPDRGRSVPGSN